MRINQGFKDICRVCRLPMLWHGTGQVHMTEGPILEQLLCFMVPLLVSQILQQFYGIADTAMVGQYLGAAALAALGTSNLFLAVIVNFYIGLSAGISVILSRLFGSRSYEELNSSIQTILLSCIIIGIGFTITGILGMDYLLNLLDTPPDIAPVAACYLQVSFLGLTAQLLYNVGNSMLQALGNTTSAFHYLLVSALLNLILDYLFIAVIPMGVMGAALATIISQYLSAVLVLRKLFCLEGDWHFAISRPLINLYYLKELVIMGIPAGMQAFFMSLSSLVIQTYINSFGYGAMAGMLVFARIEGFLYFPLFSFGLALTSFIGQNAGAGRFDRVQEGMRLSLKITVVGSIAVGAVVMGAAPYILQIFTSDNNVITNGLQAVYVVFPFYWSYAINQVYIGGIRGLGNTVYPMMASLIAYSIFRVVWCQAWDLLVHDMLVVYNSYNASFFVMLIILYFGYKYYFNKAVDHKAYSVQNA